MKKIKHLLFLFVLLLGSFAYIAAQGNVVVTYTNGTSTLNVPTGIDKATVEAWGGGAAGGAASLGNQSGGGGGGAYARMDNYSWTGTYDVKVGAGGSASGSSASPGGASTFGSSLLTANGGGGVSQNNESGGAGGTASAETPPVTASHKGGSGGNGNGAGALDYRGGGGGGSSAGTAVDGNPGGTGNKDDNDAEDMRGAGGVAPIDGGAGGYGGAGSFATGVPAQAGWFPGGGGGGGAYGLGSNGSRGAGASGQVVVTFDVPEPTIISSTNEMEGCYGTMATLIANIPDISPIEANVSYRWLRDNNPAEGINNAPIYNITTTSLKGEYTLEITYDYTDFFSGATIVTKPEVVSTDKFVLDEFVPEISSIGTDIALCAGKPLMLSTPTITKKYGSGILGQGWQIEGTAGLGDFDDFTPSTVTADHNGKAIRYYVENECGTGYSNTITVNVTSVDNLSLTLPGSANGVPGINSSLVVGQSTLYTATDDFTWLETDWRVASGETVHWKFEHGDDIGLASGSGGDLFFDVPENTSPTDLRATYSVWVENAGCKSDDPLYLTITVRGTAVNYKELYDPNFKAQVTGDATFVTEITVNDFDVVKIGLSSLDGIIGSLDGMDALCNIAFVSGTNVLNLTTPVVVTGKVAAVPLEWDLTQYDYNDFIHGEGFYRINPVIDGGSEDGVYGDPIIVRLIVLDNEKVIRQGDLVTAPPSSLYNIDVENGDRVPEYIFPTSNLPAGTIVNWKTATRSGTGLLPAFTASNPSDDTDLVIEYELWLSYGDYEALDAPVYFTITVTPKLIKNWDLKASADLVDQITCYVSDPSEEPDTYNPFAKITFTAADNLDGDVTDETEFRIEFVGGNNVVSNLETIAAGDPAEWEPVASGIGKGYYRAVPIRNNAEGVAINFTLEVRVSLYAPSVVSVKSLVYNNGDFVSPIDLISSLPEGATLSWSVADPAIGNSIGLAAEEGIGFIPSFIAKNNTDLPVECVIEYQLSYFDNRGCADEGSFTITVNPLAPLTIKEDFIVAHPTCADPNSGAIAVNVEGGSGNYQFEWSNGHKTSNPTGLTAGEYIVTISDLVYPDVTPITRTFILKTAEYDPLTIAEDFIVVDPSCAVSDGGAIALNVKGGTGSYKFEWSNGHKTSNPTGLTSGEYTVTISDLGCPAVAPITRTFVLKTEEYTPLVVEPTVVNPTCAAPESGAIALNVSGGAGGGITGNYKFAWSYGVPGIINNPKGLKAGEYTVTVSDILCPAVAPVTMTFTLTAEDVTPLWVDVKKTVLPTCTNSGGEIEVAVDGGLGTEYIVTFNGEEKTITTSSGSNKVKFNKLSAGTYNLMVRDNTCLALAPVYLNVVIEAEDVAPLAVAVNELTHPSCVLPNSGSVRITATGGSGNYIYKLDGREALLIDGLFIGLSAGTYNIVVTDKDCPAVLPVHLMVTLESIEFDPLSVDVEKLTSPTCENPENGSVKINVDGGTGFYTYKLNGDSNHTGLFSGLSAGTYNLVVTDRLCEAMLPVHLEVTLETVEFNPLAVDVEKLTLPTCDAPDGGSVQVTATSGSGKYIYTLNGESNATGFFDGLSAGTYNIVVADSCAAVLPVHLEVTLETVEFNPLAVDVEKLTLPTCDAPDGGSVQVTATSGSGKYIYTLNGESNATGFFDGLSAGTYNIVVADSCAAVLPVHLPVTLEADVAPLIVTPTVVQPADCDSKEGSIELSVTGGSGKYAYVWSNGKTTSKIDDLAAGVYTVTVTDSGCVALAPVTLTFTLQSTVYKPITLLISKSNPTCANNNGSITVVPTGGSGEYEYTWSHGSTIVTGNAGSNLPFGTYIVTVRDKNCASVLPVTQEITLDPDYNLIKIDLVEKVDPTCPGENNGRIVIAVSGGNGDYTYAWTGTGIPAGKEGDKDQLNLPAGTYNVTVRAAGTSCSAELTNIILTDPATIVASNFVKLGDLTYRNGEYVPTINLSDNLPEGFAISWTATPNPNTIGVANSGGAEIPGFLAKFTDGGANVVTITYTIVDLNCATNEATGSFKITIEKKFVSDLDLYMNPIIGQEICFGKPFEAIALKATYDGANTFAGTVTYRIEFESGDNILDWTTTNSTETADAGNSATWTPKVQKAGTGTYRITPYWNNTEGKSALVVLTVYPEVKVDAISDIVLCNESPLNVNFTGSTAGTIFDWTAPANALGIPAAGTNTISISKLLNNTDAAITVEITVTPRANGQTACTGTPDTFTVTVLPTPVVNVINNVILEPGETTTATQIAFTGTATSYIWTSSNPAISTNLAMSGNAKATTNTAYLPVFTTQNTNSEPVVSVITVTPVYTASGLTCYGEPTTFSILVMPKIALLAINDLTVCEGVTSQPIVPNGLPTGPEYYITWIGGEEVGLPNNVNVNSTTPGNKVNSIPAFKAKTTTAGEATEVTVTVKPCIYYGGNIYEGNPVDFKITVLPNVVIAAGYAESAPNVLISPCENDPVTIDVVATGTNLTYQWYKDEIAIPGATDAVYTIAALGLSDAGKYHCIVSGECDSQKSKTYIITTRVNVLKQSWNDVIVMITNPDNNGGFEFSNIQWYEVIGGVPVLIQGENKSYLAVAGGVVGKTYIASALTQYGIVYESCPFTGIDNQELEITVRPNPVKAGQTFSVDVKSSVNVTGMRLQFTDLQGVMLRSIALPVGITDLVAPYTPGTYLINIVKDGDKVREYKVIVN